jgi:hypothetical protein
MYGTRGDDDIRVVSLKGLWLHYSESDHHRLAIMVTRNIPPSSVFFHPGPRSIDRLPFQVADTGVKLQVHPQTSFDMCGPIAGRCLLDCETRPATSNNN